MCLLVLVQQLPSALDVLYFSGEQVMAQQGVGIVLNLYRRILRLHRQKLPPPMRDIGDHYVRSEFQLHLRGKTTGEQWKQFMGSWGDYADVLVGNAKGRSGDLSPEVLGLLSEDQKKTLEELKTEIQKLGEPPSGSNA